MGSRFVGKSLSLPGEGDSSGEQHGGRGIVPGAVFVITHQRISPGGELDPDLMAPAGMEPHMDQGSITCGEPPEFQPGLFDPGPLALHHKHLVLPAVFEE